MRPPVALLLPPRARRGSATGVATNLRGTVRSLPEMQWLEEISVQVSRHVRHYRDGNPGSR